MPQDSRGFPVTDATIAVVIEDDEDIRELVSTVLEQAGYEVHGAGTGAEGVELVRRHHPVVTTLDVSMPGMDGFETARRIRAISSTYIVMLTARTDEIDTIQGLQAGADDYLAKPFRPRELRARIEAMLRRPRAFGQTGEARDPHDSAADPAGLAAGPTAPTAVAATAVAPAAVATIATTPAPADGDAGGWLEHRGLQLNPEMRSVMRGTEELVLTRSEFDILTLLMRSGRRVVSKGALALTLRGEEHAGFSGYVSEHDARAIEVHVANLRRKLGESATKPQWVETIRGVGYRMTAG